MQKSKWIWVTLIPMGVILGIVAFSIIHYFSQNVNLSLISGVIVAIYPIFRGLKEVGDFWLRWRRQNIDKRLRERELDLKEIELEMKKPKEGYFSIHSFNIYPLRREGYPDYYTIFEIENKNEIPVTEVYCIRTLYFNSKQEGRDKRSEKVAVIPRNQRRRFVLDIAPDLFDGIYEMHISIICNEFELPTTFIKSFKVFGGEEKRKIKILQ